MSTRHPYLVQLVMQYSPLFTRYARRLTGSSQYIAEAIVKEAMEESYEAGEFRNAPQLRSILKNRIKAKAKLFLNPSLLN